MTLYYCVCEAPKKFFAKPKPCKKCNGHLSKEEREKLKTPEPKEVR